MASLKDLRGRINSVKSTRKITSAMKMVAASKLRRAQAAAEAARPYAERMEAMLKPPRLQRRRHAPVRRGFWLVQAAIKVHLIIPITADRGLAGAFNSGVGRQSRSLIRRLRQRRQDGQDPRGRAARGVITSGGNLPRLSTHELPFGGRKVIEFAQAKEIADRVTQMFDAGEFDVATIVYNQFKSVISQVPTETQLIPLPMPEEHEPRKSVRDAKAIYEFEPDEETILLRLLPQNLAIQVYRAMLESAAGFYGAQMSSMDNATRNAGDMINRLTLNYNRTRQANITRELIEIISGAEAL